MDTKNVIDYKIKKIINLSLTKGVQPEELSENIWSNDYKKINLSRYDDNIICCITFLESKKDITMKYIYSLDKTLIRIEEIIDNNSLVLFDRESKLKELLDDLNNLLIINYSENQVRDILNTLPKDLRIYIDKKIQIA